MAPARDPQPIETSCEQMGCLGGLVRLAWLIGGGAALAMLALSIARRGSFSVLDVAYWLVVVVTAIVRLIDITRFHGKTADLEPATMATWRRYVVKLALISAGVWALAHFVLPPLVP